MNISYQYLAGLLDGDGSINILKSSGDKRIGEYCLRVSFYSQNIDTLTKIRVQLGYGTEVGKYTTGYVFALVISSNQAARLLKEVEPYMMTRRDQARLGIEFQSRRTDYVGGPGRRVPPDETALRHMFYERMKELNARDALRLRAIQQSLKEGKIRPPTILSVVVTN